MFRESHPPPQPWPARRVSNSRMEEAARGQGPTARTRGRESPGDSAELGPEVTGAAAPEGVCPGPAGGSARTSCAAPEARVGH